MEDLIGNSRAILRRGWTPFTPQAVTGRAPEKGGLMSSVTAGLMEATLRAVYAERRVVVTGAAGFLGSHVCERLVGLGATVVGIDDLSTGRLDNLGGLDRTGRFELMRHDITVPYTVPGSVDYLLHLASPASPLDYARLPLATLKVGAVGTWNSLEIAHDKACRFLLASTSEVYGDPLEHPQRESYWGHVNPIGPRSVYDESKRFAEALTTAFRREGSADTVIVRIFNTYGPRMRPDDGRMVPAFIRQALGKVPLTVTGDGTQTRALCYVDDTVTGILLAAAGRYNGPFNLGSPDEVTVLEVAERIRKLCAAPAGIALLPLPPDDPRRRCPDITAAKAMLGWEPRVALEDGLTRTVDWMVSRLPAAGQRQNEPAGSLR